MNNDKMREALEKWLERELPAGTVIGDPKWWAQRILQAALQSQSNTPQDGFDWPKLQSPAKVGAGTFREGVSSRLVVMAAQRSYQNDLQTPTQQQASGEAVALALDKARRYVIMYNDDGEFGQVTGWLYSFADDFYADGSHAYVWRKLPATVESISPVTGMTPTQQRIHDLECQSETDKAVIEQLLSTPSESQAGTTQEAVAFEAREIGEGEWFRVGLDEKERIAAYIASPQMDYRWLYDAPPQVDAAVEAFRVKAVDVVQSLGEVKDSAYVEAILNIPGSTAALEEGYMRVAERVNKEFGAAKFHDDELRAIVQAEIKGEGK